MLICYTQTPQLRDRTCRRSIRRAPAEVEAALAGAPAEVEAAATARAPAEVEAATAEARGGRVVEAVEGE